MCDDAPDPIKKIQKEADKQLKGFEGSVKTELGGARNTIMTEIRGAGESLGMNTDQDFMPKIDVGIQDLGKIIPKLNQDFTKVSLTGLAAEVPKIGSAIQQGAIDAGSALQQNLIAAGSAMQQNAINFGRDISEGQSNPTLQGLASSATKATETNIANLSGDIETNFEGITQTTEDLVSSNVAGIEALPKDTAEFVDNAGAGFQLLIDQFLPGGGGSGGSSGGGLADTPELPEVGDEEIFPGIEASTTKADQLTEEERQRRIRRLMLNRYGREDTILTGARDMTNRRRYASAL